MWFVLTEPGMTWLWIWFVLREPCSVDLTCKSKNCQTSVVHHRTERHADRLTNKSIQADWLMDGVMTTSLLLCKNSVIQPMQKVQNTAARLIHFYTPSRRLRSSTDTRVFRITSFRTKSCGQHSFSYQAPVIWNQLPVAIILPLSILSNLPQKPFSF